MNELDQAVLDAVITEKTGGISDSVLQEFCEVLKLDIHTAKIMVYIMARYVDVIDDEAHLTMVENAYEEFGSEERDLIEKAYHLAIARIRCKRAVRDQQTVGVPLHLLLAPAEADQLCVKCPSALKCIALQSTTPMACYTYRVNNLACEPVRVRDFQVDVMDPFTGQVRAVGLLEVRGKGAEL